MLGLLRSVWCQVTQSLPRWNRAVSVSHVTPRQRRDAQCKKKRNQHSIQKVSIPPTVNAHPGCAHVSMLRRSRRHVTLLPAHGSLTQVMPLH